MKKILLILSVMCLIPFFAQAQGTECRPVSQFEVTADYDDVTLNWQLPTSSEIKYYEGSPANEIGTLADNVLWMAFRIPASVLAEYPSTADYPFTLEKVKFIPTVTTGVHYQVDVYTADPNGPASGDFTATRVNSYTVTDAVADAFNYVSVGTEIDKTQDLIIAVKATGENLSTLRFTEEGAVNGYSNLISLDGVEFDYVYENSHSAPISWYICAVVDYPNEDGQKGWGDIEPIDNMNVYKPANVIASKSIPNVETVDHYIIYRDNVEIAQVDGGIFTYVDADLPHVTHTYTYGIVVAHNDNGVLCDSRVVEKNITLYFCVDDDNNISNIYGMANPEERTIAVYWTAPVNPNVLGYEVRCFNDNAGTCVKVAFTELTEYTLSGMEAGDYHFCVNAVYDGCASEDFCTGIINLPVECGYPVTELTAAQGVLNVKMVNVAWTAPFTTHLIEYYTINKYVPYSDVLIASYTTTGTEYADFDVEFYNSYDYEVVANYVDGCVSVPVATSAYVGLEPIANLVASTTSEGQITLTWDAPTQEGLTGYMITVNDETYTSETNTYINIYPAGSYYFQVYAVYSDQYYAIPVGINVVISGTEQYIINATVNPAEGGSVAGYGTYLNGQTALLTAVHAPEYAFINWTEDGVEVSNDEEYSFIVTGNRNLVANFLPLNVLWIGNYVAHSENNVEIAINLHNYIDDVYAFQFDIPLGELEYVDGSLAVTDRTNENFVVNTTLYENNTLRIVGYSMPPTAVPGTDGAIVTLEIVAHSEEVFPLTITDPVLSDLYGNILYCETRDGELAIDDVNIEAVTVPLEGGVTTGTGVYFTGEQVTVTVTPNEGYTFVDWLENGVIVASTPEYTFIAGADRVLIAVMSLNTYYISVTANPAEGGVVTGEGAYNHFETAVLTATPADGYMFTNWTENGLVVSDDAIYTFTVRGNRNLVAHFIGVNVLSIPTTLMGHVDQPATINVDLDNDVDLVYGFQFDIPLGDMTYVYGSIALTDRDDDSHHISAEVISGNVLRVIDYSMPPVPLAGTDGAICTFDVTAPVEGTFTLAIQNEVLTDMMGNVLYSETVDGLLTIEDVNIFVTADPIDGGTFTGNGVYYIGETVTLTATPNIGYAFLYWKEGETEYTDNPYIFAAGLDRSFVACFELVDYYITAIVNPDGFGTISGVDNPYHYGDVATLTATPASDEYAFDAWTENGVVVSQDETYSFTVTSDMVIVANFVYNNFLVVEDVESLPNVLVDIPVNLINHNDVVYGFQFDITIPDGLTFVGVEKSDRLSESHILMAMPIAGNVIRILDYAMPPEAISGTEGAICTIQVVATETGDYPMNVDATTAAISGIDGSLFHLTTVNGTLSVSQVNITVSALPEEGGTVTGGGAYIYGTTVVVNAYPAIGYSFLYWTENGSIVTGNAQYEFTATVDRNLVANFELIDYYITANVNPEGFGTISGVDNPYHYGDVATLTAIVPSDDYAFISWTEDGVIVSKDETYSFTVTSDRNLVANFVYNNYLVVEDVEALPNTIVNIPVDLTNHNDVVYGFQFDITLPDGLTFVGVEKSDRLSEAHVIMGMPIDGKSNVIRILDYAMPPEAIFGTEGPICTIQVVAAETGDYPMNIDATTAAISGIDGSLYHVTTVDGTLSVSQINITVSAIPEEGGTVTGGGAYIYGAAVAVSASPEIGYSFVCWIEDGNIVSRNALYEFTATEDRDLVAYFLHNTYYVNVTVNPEGHGLVMGLDNPYYYGDVVTLTAVSVDENDYTFVNWTENGVEVSADKTYSFTLVSDRNLVANFANNNVISVESVTGLPGVVTDVPINLHNTNDVVYGFQFDVTIPEGLTYVGIEKTYRLSDSHIIMAMPISDNVLRVLDYSIPPAQIDGVDGPVCLIQFQAAENGVYPLTLDGAVLSNVDGGLYNVTTVDGTLTISGVTVEAVANPAEGGTVTGAGVYAIGAAVTMTAFPAEGYAFINWTENGAEITTDASWTFVATTNHSFVANFSSVNITVTANPTEGGTVTGGGVYPYGSEVIVNAIPAEGYAFRWWLKDNEIVSTDAFWSFTAVEDLNLVAYFSSINTLSIPTNLIGYVDKPVTVPVYLDNPIDNVYGFQFDIELGDLTYVEGSATVADRTSSNFYIVATVIDGNVLRVLGYSIPPTPVSGTYGDICTFDVMPSAEGNYLLPITNDVLSDEAGNILYSYAPLSGLVIVGAMQEYVINAIANPAEGGTITGAGVYETGDIVTLTATAAEGYTFVNWTDDFDNVISLDNSYTFVVVESRTLIANFVLDVTITVAADPVDGGSVLGGGVYSYGDVVTLIATPAMGYAFMYWMENNISISESPVLSFTATEDRDLVAYFSSVNTLSIPQNLFGYATEEITVPVSLNNPVDDVYGFQFDIELGELTYVDGSAVVTDRTNSNFYIVASVIDNNVLRILGYSIPPTAISGENGVICTFGVTAPEEGYYLLPITNSVLSGMVGNILYSYAPFPGLITVDELAEYTVIVNAIPAEAGTVTGGGVYTQHDIATVTATANDGYTFNYWTNNEGNIVSGDNSFSFTVVEDCVLNANFTVTTVNIEVSTYSTGGIVIGGGLYHVGDMVQLFAIADDCYTFEYWADANGNILSYDNPYSFIAAEDITIFAHFTQASYTVTAWVNPTEGGTITGVSNPYNCGDVATLTAVPAENYSFDGWYSAGALISSDATYSFTVNDNVWLMAQFSIESITITASADPEEYGVVSGAGSYIVGSTVNLIAYPFPGYYFINWTENGAEISTDDTYTFIATVDRTLVAHFAMDSYTVTVNVDPADGGTVTGAGTYIYNDMVTLTATPNGDYQFVNWTDEAGNVVASGAQYSFNITSDRTFTAHFAIEYHTVTINVDPVEGGTVAGAGTYLLNEFVTLTATVNDGYEFVSWTDENDNVVAFGTQYSFYITNDRVFTAHFVEDGLYPVVSMDIDHENLTAVVTWVPTAGSDPLYYVVCAIQGENSYTSLNTAETTATIKFVEEDTYIIGVAAVYDNGMSDFVTGYVDIEVNEINNFRVSNPSLNIVELTWDPCPSDRFNDFYRYHITGGSAPIDIYNINDTTFTDYLTVPGVYTYCITIEYGPQGIVSTDEICHPITIEQGAMFPAVILNQPIVVNMTADVSWQVAYPLAVEYYNVYIDNVKVGMTSDMSYICKLATEDVHTVSVEAIYEYGTSDRTSSTFINDVNEISNLNISQNFEELTLTWNAPLDTYNDFVYYTITRNGAYLADIYNINETTYTDYIENGNTTYNYCITVSYLASNNNYVVSQPVCKSITVAEIFPPVTYISVDNENLSFLATWPAMPGAVSYTVSGVVDNPVTVVDPQFFGSVDEVALQTITVVVNYAQGSSIPANEEFQISLNAPKNFTAVPNGGDIVMTWGAPNDKYGDLTGYVITRNSEVVATVAAEVLTYTDTPDYGIYEYCVKAQYGYAYYSASDCQSSVAPECPAVTDLYGAFNFNDGTVTLYWTAPTNGTFTYNVYRNNVKIASVDQPTYVDSGINSYDDYVYNISVVCFDGVESNLSNPFSGSFACGGFPVENLRAVYDNAGGQPNVTLTWDKPLDFIDGQVYNIYRQGELIASQYAGTTYVDYVNIPSGTYSYTVTEVCPDGSESLPSTVNVAVETGIDDFNISVNVYPNPTAGDVTIECENMNSITIYNSLGQVVRNISVDANSITVSTSDMSSGVYIFNIINNDGNAIQKRVIVSK